MSAAPGECWLHVRMRHHCEENRVCVFAFRSMAFFQRHLLIARNPGACFQCGNPIPPSLSTRRLNPVENVTSLDSYVLVCAQVSSRVTSVKLSCRNTAPADGPRVIAFKLMVVWMCLGRSVYEDWGFWMHVFMTNGSAIEIPCSTLSIWYDGKRFHANLHTLHLRQNILSLDIISTTKEKSERVNEIEREPEAWGAVRFKFVRITSSYLLSVGPWCDGLICSALPVVTVYVLRETVQIERQWAVQHFTPQPEHGYLIWKQTHTHSPFFWLRPAQHIVSITLLLWPLSRAVSSDCRQIEPLHPLPHWHAHIPPFIHICCSFYSFFTFSHLTKASDYRNRQKILQKYGIQ